MISDVTLDNATWAQIPARFEAGTPPIIEAVGLHATVDYLDSIGMDNVFQHDRELTEIPQCIDEVIAWLGTQGIEPDGAPYIRYYAIDMDAKLDIEVGWQVASALEGNGHIQGGVLPAGRYATLIYTGVENGIKGNGTLIQWARNNRVEWDRWDDEKGDAFRSRVEFFLTNPDEEPDPSKWETEVAILVQDGE
jgi:effector-binding domain-containing protein